MRGEIHADVCASGWDAERNSFVQLLRLERSRREPAAAGADRIPPPDDPRYRGTVEAIERELMVDGLVLRYDTARIADDGLPAGEGAFLACSFWLADAYLLLGRRDDAERLFERLIALRNDVGLLSRGIRSARATPAAAISRRPSRMSR